MIDFHDNLMTTKLLKHRLASTGHVTLYETNNLNKIDHLTPNFVFFGKFSLLFTFSLFVKKVNF